MEKIKSLEYFVENTKNIKNHNMLKGKPCSLLLVSVTILRVRVYLIYSLNVIICKIHIIVAKV